MTVTLYNKDVFDMWPELAGIPNSAIVTDPPYGINLFKNGRETVLGSRKGQSRAKEAGTKFRPVHGDDRPFDPGLIISYCYTNRPIMLFGANYYAQRLPASSAWFVWDKRDGVKSNCMADGEMVWSNLKSPMRIFSHKWMGMIKDSERNETRLHPNQKPVALAEWLLEFLPPNVETIIDPYMGSGSIGVAALRKGFNYVGVEIDKSYYLAARRRLKGV